MSTRVLLWVMPSFLQVTWIERIYDCLVERNAAKPLATVDRYGGPGLALFTGGAMPARFRDHLLASFLGCLLAAVAVTAVVASGNEAFHFTYKDLSSH